MNTARSFGPAVVTGFPFGTQWIVRLLSLNCAFFYELIQTLAHSIGWGLLLVHSLRQSSTSYSSSNHASSFFPPTPNNAHSLSAYNFQSCLISAAPTTTNDANSDGNVSSSNSVTSTHETRPRSATRVLAVTAVCLERAFATSV